MKITVELSYKEFRALMAKSGRSEAKQLADDTAAVAKVKSETAAKPADTITMIGLEWDKYDLDGQHNFDDANRLAAEAGKRLPTKEEFEALWEFPRVWDYDRKGLWIAPEEADLKDTDKALFFPASGYSGGANSQGSNGYFWSSSELSTSLAFNLLFHASRVYPAGVNDKSYRFSVRCVRSL